MKHLKKTAIAMGLAQMTMMLSGAAVAQTTDTTAKPDASTEPSVVVVTGQRAALQSAQKIKQNSDEIVDSIVADDIGKLPDRSVTEVLQRVVGVTIDRTMSKGDPEHFSVEGSGVSIRGLSYVRSELNGRDSFSANGGRSLNFEDVPPELMAGVDVYKNPSAEQIEGAIGGLVNLRTAMPFDFKGFKAAVSADRTYSELKKGKASPSYSGMVSDRWKTPIGEIGALLDLAYSESATRTDAIQVEPYYPMLDANGNTVYAPKGAQWRTLEFNRKREGAYGALQWKKDDLSSSLTWFKSRYQMQWNEQAIFAQSSPYNIKLSPDSTFNSQGQLLTGTLTDPADGGINMGDDTRVSNRKSNTTDLSWNLRWRINNSWTATTDFQHIRADTGSFDSTVATGVTMPKEKLDLGGNMPSLTFDDADRAYLANPNNYYWAFTMEHFDKSVATENAWKTDFKYDFDHPVLRDFRFGFRLTDRNATTVNSNPSYNWAAITQPWQVGWDIKNLAYLGDPRFSGNTSLHNFTNFFGGSVNVPSVVFPNASLAQNYPGSYAQLHTYHDVLCQEINPATNCAAWTPATFGTDPSGTNDQSEKTKALYGQLRFGWDDLKYPIDGNVGLRYVKTDSTAHGYTVFSANLPSGTLTGVPIPNIQPFAQAQDFQNDFHNVLPSLNLRLKASDALQFRLAVADAIARPDFTQLQAYNSLTQSTTNSTVGGITTVSQVSQTGTGSGNPNLRPTKSRQIDLTAEWYFAPSGSFTAAVFDKQLKDIVVNQLYNYQLKDTSGGSQNFLVTGPVNGAKGYARGIELAFQQYFDKLPGAWSGLGIQANYTFVDSKRELYSPINQKYCSGSSGGADNLNLNLNGCDTNGLTFGDLPLEGLSRQSYNLALLYDKGPWSARLAYNWRAKALQAVNVNGTQGTDGLDTNPASSTYGQHVLAWGLPTWSAAYGELDGSVFYKFNEKVQLGLEAQNLTNALYRQLMQQHSGMNTRAVFSTGPRVSAKLSYSFD